MSLKLNNFIYVSTFSDLGGDMLKLDVLPGEYKLKEFLGGYILSPEEYQPNRKDLIKIFNYRDGNKGLSGTYHCGGTKDIHILNLFNDYIFKNLSEKSLEGLEHSAIVEDYKSDDDVVKAKFLPDYNNIPVIFYLNTQIGKEDIKKISLQKCSGLSEIGNVMDVFIVKYLKENNEFDDIGIVVHQEIFFNMMADQAGVALLHEKGTNARGLGNFNRECSVKDDSEVNYPYYDYVCSFKPCNCDVFYD